MNRQPQLIPMGIGERLQSERLEQGFTTAEVASMLRIDEPVIIALEADKLHHLAHLYRRGYVSNYAKFLKIDAAETEQMLESMEHGQPELHTVFPSVRNPNTADRWLKATSYILASLLISTLAWQFTHEAVRLSQKSPGAVSQEDAASRSQGPGNPGQVKTSQTAKHVNASIASMESIDKRPATVNGAGKGAWAALRQEVAESPLASGLSLLELTASGDSWVEITDSEGRQLELDLIRGGTSKQYTGAPPFNIQFGRASALNLFLDGAAVDLAPFTKGGVAQMVLAAPVVESGAPGVQVPEQDADGG